MKATNWKNNLKVWESRYIDRMGRYTGLIYGKKADALMLAYGFPYLPGGYVPVDQRYSASQQWNYAVKIVVKKHWEDVRMVVES